MATGKRAVAILPPGSLRHCQLAGSFVGLTPKPCRRLPPGPPRPRPTLPAQPQPRPTERLLHRRMRQHPQHHPCSQKRSSPPPDHCHCCPPSRQQGATLWPLPCPDQHAIPQPPPYRVSCLSGPAPQPPQLRSVIRDHIRWAWRGRGRGRGVRFLPTPAPRRRRLGRSWGRRSGGQCAAPCARRLLSSSSSCIISTGRSTSSALAECQ